MLMDGISQQPAGELQRLQASREELIERIARAISEDGVSQPLTGVHLARLSTPMEKVHSLFEPSLCVIAQGSKVVFGGDSRYQYDPFNYFLATIELPRASQVLEASKERPYLSFRLELDPNLVGSVLVETGHFITQSNADVRAIDVSPLDADLLDAVVRLVKVLVSPVQTPTLPAVI